LCPHPPHRCINQPTVRLNNAWAMHNPCRVCPNLSWHINGHVHMFICLINSTPHVQRSCTVRQQGVEIGGDGTGGNTCTNSAVHQVAALPPRAATVSSHRQRNNPMLRLLCVPEIERIMTTWAGITHNAVHEVRPPCAATLHDSLREPEMHFSQAAGTALLASARQCSAAILWWRLAGEARHSSSGDHQGGRTIASRFQPAQPTQRLPSSTPPQHLAGVLLEHSPAVKGRACAGHVTA
jgi:hypothetical protein